MRAASALARLSAKQSDVTSNRVAPGAECGAQGAGTPMFLVGKESVGG